jgi:N utilization substance protein B
MQEKEQKNTLAHNRHNSRVLALCTLYAYEVDNGCDWGGMLESIAENDGFCGKVRDYARKLVGSALENLESIDAMIAQKAQNWELRRMAAVDRNMLRLASAELRYFMESVPYRVVIDEAVEIAKAYGTDDSGKFVNGILDSIRKELYNKTGGGRELKIGDGCGEEEKKEPAKG